MIYSLGTFSCKKIIVPDNNNKNGKITKLITFQRNKFLSFCICKLQKPYIPNISSMQNVKILDARLLHEIISFSDGDHTLLNEKWAKIKK